VERFDQGVILVGVVLRGTVADHMVVPEDVRIAVVPPILNCAALLSLDGDVIPCFMDHVTPGPQLLQMSYFGASSP